MEAFVVALQSVWNDSGFSAFTMGHAIMMLVGIILLYLEESLFVIETRSSQIIEHWEDINGSICSCFTIRME